MDECKNKGRKSKQFYKDLIGETLKTKKQKLQEYEVS
jgi:hypothetical protein